MIDRIHPDLRSLAIPLDELHEDPDNANAHDERSLATLAEMFNTFQQRKNLVVRREGMVMEAGSGTLAALRAAGWTHVACIVCDDDEQTAKAYGLADNQSARLSQWNPTALRDRLDELVSDGYNVTSLGWTGDELADILAGKSQALSEQLSAGGNDKTDESDTQTSDAKAETQQDTSDQSAVDKVPEPPAEPITRPGDVWLLGKHRLICGDCRDPAVVSRLLADTKINVAFTSPPYASQRKYDESSGFKPIHPDEFVDWFEAVQANVRTHLADDGSWFVNIKEHCEDGERHLYVKDLTIAHKRRWGWKFIDELVWTRTGQPGHPLKMGHRFKNGFEPVFQFASATSPKMRPDNVRHVSSQTFKYDSNVFTGNYRDIAEGGARPDFNTGQGYAYPSNVLNIAAGDNNTEHSAAFPVGLPAFFIKAYSDEGDAVYDPFSGSGTTIIACERLNRRGFGCEISPRYCDVIVKRWETQTGLVATREV